MPRLISHQNLDFPFFGAEDWPAAQRLAARPSSRARSLESPFLEARGPGVPIAARALPAPVAARGGEPAGEPPAAVVEDAAAEVEPGGGGQRRRAALRRLGRPPACGLSCRAQRAGSTARAAEQRGPAKSE